MADPRKSPLPVLWSVATPGSASLIHATARQVLARCGRDVLAFDCKTGALEWSTSLSERAGEGTFLTEVDGTALTDTRTGPQGTTVVVGLRDGKVAWSAPMEAIVGAQGTAVIGDELFVLGTDPKGGTVLRSLNVRTGARQLELRRPGRDLAAAGDRLVVLASFTEPGLISLSRQGTVEQLIESTPAQELAVQGVFGVAALRTGKAPERTLRGYDLRDGRALWSHPCHGAVVAADAECAFHLESSGAGCIAVARDLSTGSVRWRSDRSLGDDSGVFRSAGGLLAFAHGTGTTLLRRDDGRFVAELAVVYALEARGPCLYLEGSERIACVEAQLEP